MKILIHSLINKSIACIKHDVPLFISLALLHIFIMLSLIVGSEWIGSNIDIYPLSLGPIILRISLFCLILGVWIGYFKLIFSLIDKKTKSIISIFHTFYLLPKVFLARLLSYFTVIPIFIFMINKFPYNINKYGTNVEQYFSDLLLDLTTIYSDEISRNLYFAYFNYTDIVILFFLILLPIFFTLRFWCLEIILIDSECSMKRALILSYALTKSVYQFVFLGILVMLINIIMMFFGFIFFMVSLTISYILIFQYYRWLLTKVSL